MADLSHLSDEDLDKMISEHENASSIPEQKDYSHQTERGFTDPLRDLAYGAVHGPWEFGKMAGNLVTGGHLEELPFYNKYIPFIEKHIESIKSPHPSPTGDMLQIAGEFGIPGGITAKAGKKALALALEKYPLAFTEKGATKGLKEIAESTEGIGGKFHSPEVAKKLKQIFREHAPLHSARGHVEELLGKEGYEPAFQLQSFLEKMRGRLNKFNTPIESQVAGDVVNLQRQKLIEDIGKILEEKGGSQHGNKLRTEQARYKNYLKIKKGLYEPAKKYAAPLGIGYELVHQISKLLGK